MIDGVSGGGTYRSYAGDNKRRWRQWLCFGLQIISSFNSGWFTPSLFWFNFVTVSVYSVHILGSGLVTVRFQVLVKGSQQVISSVKRVNSGQHSELTQSTQSVNSDNASQPG
ncbi:hypothetical protein HanRHA438_Chr15g0728241 [Helianthus annuus]|nr:hypothetical protein HanRHA438_Chr15g0728241 [Helianthus annuus]